MPNEREIEIARLVKFPENRDDLARLLKDYRLDLGMNRAELTAPAEGDAEAADPDELTAEIERLVREMKPADRYLFIRYKIAAALTAARKDAEARVKALEAENLGLRKTVGVDGKEIAELRADLAAARRDALNKAFPYTRGLLAKARAHVKVLEAVARSAEIDLGIAIDILEKHNYVHAKELQETRDKLAALLAGEGKGEE